MKALFFILLSLPGLCSYAQSAHDNQQPWVRVFYQKTAGQPVWITAEGRHNLNLLTHFFSGAVYLGLDANDYEPLLLRTLTNNSYIMPAAADTMDADRRITAAAIQFFRDIAYGRLENPPVKYNGLPLLPGGGEDIASRLAECLLKDQFSRFLLSVEPVDTGYIAVKNRLAATYTIIMDTAFKEIPVTSLTADSSNLPLLRRLRQVEVTDTVFCSLQDRIRRAQHLFNTLDDGILRSRFLQALNVPLLYRLQELKNALNQLRWLRYYKANGALVLVNIPSTELTLYMDSKPVLYSRVITGKKSTPTPTLGSRITEVVLFPYWTVPNKIAVRELLPHIKRDRQYLVENQFEILDRKGHIVDPSQVNWSQLGIGNFPYVIRQNTGCDNSLGIVKLNFYSPFGVYLHDTPGKNLFMLQQRFFSHGCVRVEEAVLLAHLLLKEQAGAMETLEAKGSQPDQHPVIFPVPGMAYVLILYNTAWPDAAGQVRFYENVYNRN